MQIVMQHYYLVVHYYISVAYNIMIIITLYPHRGDACTIIYTAYVIIYTSI